MVTTSLVATAILTTLQAIVGFAKDPPTPPTRYVTGLEMNLGELNTSYVVKEWYDGDLQKARRTIHINDDIFTFVEDYSNGTDSLWLYDQSALDTDNVRYCALEAYSDHTSDWYRNTVFLGQWLKTDAGSMDDAVYQGVVGDVDDDGEECGDYNMRGMLADKWTKDGQSFTWQSGDTTYNFTYNVSYFWSIEDWTYAKYGNVSNSSQIPLRLEVEGTRTESDGTETTMSDFYHSYEYVGFFDGDEAFDDDVLDFYSNVPDWVDECNTTHYCQHYPDRGVCAEEPELPVLPTQFESTIECVFESKDYSLVVDEFYDYDNNREHVIYYPYNYVSSAWGVSLPFNYSQHYVEDGEIFWTWSQDNGQSVDVDSNSVNNCTLDLTSQAGADSEAVVWFFDTDKQHVVTTAWLFGWVTNNSVQTYLGQKTTRGILCDRWKHKVQNWESNFTLNGVDYFYEVNMTVIYSFMADSVKSKAIYGDWGIPVSADASGHTRVSDPNGIGYEYDYQHYYNYVKFIPTRPDDFWFDGPTNVTCNIGKYCDAKDSFNVESSSSSESEDGIDGESSEEYIDLCDDISDDGTVYIEAGQTGRDRDHNRNDNDNDESEGDGVWIAVGIILCIVCGAIGVWFGIRRERKRASNMVQLRDDPNNPNL